MKNWVKLKITSQSCFKWKFPCFILEVLQVFRSCMKVLGIHCSVSTSNEQWAQIASNDIFAANELFKKYSNYNNCKSLMWITIKASSSLRILCNHQQLLNRTREEREHNLLARIKPFVFIFHHKRSFYCSDTEWQ